MMEGRKVDILCVQETRWKGSKAHSIGAGVKLFYYGVDSKRNGVGVVLKEEFVRNVLEVKRVSDRVVSLRRERFWSELDEVMESIPTGERVVIGADLNGHVGEGNRGDEEVMGKFGVKERNLEGQMVVDFAKRMDMAVVNTYFQKREEHRMTYKSGGRRTQVDYILYRRGNLKEISDCKLVVGESVARQHRMVVCRMILMVCKKKRSKIEKKTKWWKLKKEECCEEFRQKLRQALGGQVVLPDDWETTAEVISETGRKVLGVSSGRKKEDKETWLWNEEVQDSIQRKRLAKKKWDMDSTEENRQEYKELQRRVKREVSKAKQKAYDELYTRLDTREGQKDLYRLARQRDQNGKDVQQVRVIKDRDGRVLTSEESVQRRWKEYFEELMNEENEREKRVEGVNSVEQKVDNIRKDEVRKALKRMKSGKAVGPDDIPVEVWKCLGEAAVEFLTSLFNRVLESERMPEEWRRSVLVPIFKNKGDVQSCSNYRGIKLMSHTMKLWERVVEARLRKVVEICEQQYGFMPRKSTTDAIFALRILMEKYRDGQRELHCVFVDLEKAYDRVPREELWYCMRKSGVAEKYVRVVQDMYERSRTVVRCAVGQTEEFNVKVGLHQGSALSPFLFAIVMDQLSEEVRQESPWTMMFADDIVICSESREQVEENLERWRFALERRGMKVSRSKTEYMCVNEKEGSGTVRLQGEEVKKVAFAEDSLSDAEVSDEYHVQEKVARALFTQMIFLLIGVLVVLPHAAVGSIKVAESYWTLKANELVVDEDMDKYGTKVLVPLVCGEAFEGQKIIWKREGREELPFQANRVFVMVEERQGGTYTCYSTEGNYLNHTLVLVQWRYRKIIKGTPERGYVHCSTNNYSGFFQCFWTWDESRSGKQFGKDQQCVSFIYFHYSSHTAGNISCNLDSNVGGITCQDHAFCPYAEETDHINLTIYFRSNYVIETYYLHFRISDIVRPDMVRFIMKSNILELQYPESWSTPFSYFPLTFQVKEIRCQRKRICDCLNQRSSNNLRQALGGQVVLPDDWETTAEVIRETGRKVLGVSSGRRKEDKETWWWNEEVQDSIQRKRLAKKKWDMDRTEENRQEYKELQRRVKREVSKAKQKAYDELYTRLDTREGEKDLYRLARQRDRDGKDVQQVRVIKDRDGRVLTSEESVQRRWKEYFEELMNEENEREKRVEGVNSVEQKVDKIRKDEVRKALKRMKSGKAVGPDDIPVEVWKCLGEAAVEFLTSLFNRVLESERMPEEWRRSVLVPIFKNKGDVQSCSNYRGIKLMSHTMKLWERVVEARLRKIVEICEQQYGFMPRKSTTDAIFALRILMEKYRDGQRELHCVFVDLEKAYDRVPREELWYCMRKSGVAEKYVRVVQDMYERSRTVVRCAVDDIVICSESREQVEENLERWRFALERRGMKVSRSKTEYMCVNEREGSGTVRLQCEEVKKVQEFKYLGSTVQSNGECGKEVNKRVQAGWNGWSGETCREFCVIRKYQQESRGRCTGQ
ncbi:hypothetical protein QTP70_029528, partial [Hemibagrus guttatus]